MLCGLNLIPKSSLPIQSFHAHLSRRSTIISNVTSLWHAVADSDAWDGSTKQQDATGSKLYSKTQQSLHMQNAVSALYIYISTTTKALMVTTFWIETAQLSGWQVQLAMCHEPGWTSVPVREVPGSSLGSYFLEAAYDNLNTYFPHQRAMSTMGLFTCQIGDSNFLAFHGKLHETMVQNLYHKYQMAGKFRIMSKYQIIFWNSISVSPV